MKEPPKKSYIDLPKEFFMSLKSFKNAVHGIISSLKAEKNLRIISIIFIIVVIASFILSISATEWVVVLLCCAGVISTELINTSIEHVIDLYSKDYSLIAKKAKDTAAGATLIFCVFSILVGLVIYIPHIIDFFGGVS